MLTKRNTKMDDEWEAVLAQIGKGVAENLNRRNHTEPSTNGIQHLLREEMARGGKVRLYVSMIPVPDTFYITLCDRRAHVLGFYDEESVHFLTETIERISGKRLRYFFHAPHRSEPKTESAFTEEVTFA